MATEQTRLNGIERKKIFTGICLALLPTAFSFILVSNILNQLKTEFILTNADVGYIGGAALWGMSISLLTIGPLLEKIGLKNATKGAFIGHLSGVTLFLVAYFFAGDPSAFWILFAGAIGMGFGNGMIEVAGNPLTAALYPDNKTTKLNHFHGFYMGGLVLGGLLGWGMAQIGDIGSIYVGHWTAQMALVYVPILVYGWLLFPRKFPQTETAAAGIPIKEMFRYTFTNAGVLGLILLMMFTLAMEMGPMRWIPDVLQAAGLHGVLVLVWISGLMFLLRMFAGPFVEKFSPTGMLLGASFLTCIGLFMFSYVETEVLPLMIAGAFFAIGIAFFVPNMIGLMSERFPKAGSLGIVLLIGMGFVGGGGSNAIMGEIADSYLPDALNEQQTVSILQQVEDRFPEYVERAENAAGNREILAQLGYREADVSNVFEQAQAALAYFKENGEFDGTTTGNALRALIDSGIPQEQQLIQQASSVLRPADNYGGRMAFRWVAPIAFLAGIVFIVWFIRDQRRGGYKIERLEKREHQEISETL
ncbi:MFS transporter [Aliifodinibius sp. S!AR15-10]|uniref:MFS transporter n=1 Tax=Aliifodinibius sp. S!AR15-10 TaxID=2950437 RepID=UPI00285C734B|nr:MFS transporter [Aliifodinibius sp. S!AR15-10]MDR8393617.1 MFS transporter [Aliifodinibius sp. S!AR15-10]